MNQMTELEELTNLGELLNGFNSINLENILLTIAKYILVILIIFTIIYSITTISMCKIFKKAGRKEWKAFIPFLNTYELFEITNIDGSLIFIQFVPLIGPIVFSTIKIINKIKLAQKFNKNDVFFHTGLVLLPWIFLPILAFSDTKYIDNDKNETVPKQNTIEENIQTTNEETNAIQNNNIN